ncbi:RDD family protein [Pseudonocardia acidicola]|uniref:RDD family protein n=1 Tax=Pseudonocardia acidicola TaxID=2724939 RepID=A0ABX1S4Z2_9PSEU|nr:RDD family protein [Pseudonocardia acidicola]NMH95984.1 RDD family protein [Pseudonocardia acidicola]
MARWIDSWLPGSPVGSSAGPDGGTTSTYPGEKFGLPRNGVGAVAGFGRRLGAVTVDWLLGYLIALLFAGPDAFGAHSNFGWTVWLVWFVLTVVPVAIFGATAGMTALGIRVASIDSAALIGVPRALLRTVLLGVVIPALLRDADGRGWHDRAARTVVIRTR